MVHNMDIAVSDTIDTLLGKKPKIWKDEFNIGLFGCYDHQTGLGITTDSRNPWINAWVFLGYG